MNSKNFAPYHETRSIHGGIEIYDAFAKDLGDNGKEGHLMESCWIAPGVSDGGPDVYVYLTHEGDPNLIGWIDLNGDFRFADGIELLLETEEFHWLKQILEAEFLP